MGGDKPGSGAYEVKPYNCIGGHVSLDSSYIIAPDHNWFDAVDTFKAHEGTPGLSITVTGCAVDIGERTIPHLTISPTVLLWE